jgi:hypothetical protein
MPSDSKNKEWVGWLNKYILQFLFLRMYFTWGSVKKYSQGDPPDEFGFFFPILPLTGWNRAWCPKFLPRRWLEIWIRPRLLEIGIRIGP